MGSAGKIDLSGRRVLVTGATGFIGRRTVAALVGAGANVTALVRTRPSPGALPAGVVAVAGGLDGGAVETALQGQDAVVNLAYDVRAPAPTNLAAFDRLIRAAASAKVGRIIHTSSIVVYDNWPTADIDESGTMDRPGGSPYRRAKIEMERRLMAGALPAAILQPTIVYGPGSSLWTDALAEALLRGAIVLPSPEGLCNGVFVDDVAQAVCRAVALRDLGRERFVVSGPQPFAWSALLDGYARALGRGSVRHEPLADLDRRLGPPHDETGEDAGPSAAARVSAIARRLIGNQRFEALVRAAKHRLAKPGDLYPDHHLLGVFSGRGTCRIDHARARLGYAPDFDLAAGLVATADHLKRLAG